MRNHKYKSATLFEQELLLKLEKINSASPLRNFIKKYKDEMSKDLYKIAREKYLNYKREESKRYAHKYKTDRKYLAHINKAQFVDVLEKYLYFTDISDYELGIVREKIAKLKKEGKVKSPYTHKNIKEQKRLKEKGILKNPKIDYEAKKDKAIRKENETKELQKDEHQQYEEFKKYRKNLKSLEKKEEVTPLEKKKYYKEKYKVEKQQRWENVTKLMTSETKELDTTFSKETKEYKKYMDTKDDMMKEYLSKGGKITNLDEVFGTSF